MQTMVFPAPRGGIGGQPLIVYATTRPPDGSTSSWSGRSIGSAGHCRIWSDSLAKLTPAASNFICMYKGLTRTPAGRAMFQMMGVFAEFERAMIVERVRAGMIRAKASGTAAARRLVVHQRPRAFAPPSSRHMPLAASVCVGWPSSSASPTRRCGASCVVVIATP